MNSQVPRLNHPQKDRIIKEFSKNPSYYHKHANAQKESADRLITSLEPWKAIIPSGPILEVGCGTGFLSEHLAKMFGSRTIEISDLSPEMVEFCRSNLDKLSDAANMHFDVRDAEYVEADENTYGMILHNFVAQWFQDPALSLERMIECIKPGGLMLAAFPGNRSFPEWRRAAREAGVAYTGNKLPDTEEMVVKLSGTNVQVDYYEDTITRSYPSGWDFFRHIKKMGASTDVNEQTLSMSEMKQLINQWDKQSEGEVKAQYHVVFIAAKKD